VPGGIWHKLSWLVFRLGFCGFVLGRDSSPRLPQAKRNLSFRKPPTQSKGIGMASVVFGPNTHSLFFFLLGGKISKILGSGAWGWGLTFWVLAVLRQYYFLETTTLIPLLLPLLHPPTAS